MKIYTKTGDDGTTGLFAGPRVGKDHPRITAYGAVDELNALLGIVCHYLGEGTDDTSQQVETPPNYQSLIRSIQSDLFSVGAELACPDPAKHELCLLTQDRILALESAIDRAQAGLPELTHFILPGGSLGAAMLQLARTVCRRAEREVVTLTQAEEVADSERIIAYLNRLSDLLFVLARSVNSGLGLEEVPWHPPSA